MMFDVIDSVVTGRWFKEPSPFRSVVSQGHPKLCVITGPNTAGKSLLRKVVHNRYSDAKIEYMSVSQEQRCDSHGIQRIMIYGTEQDESTGYNSVKMLLKAFQTGQGRTKPFAIMLDEPEIGCSDETQAGIGLRIAKEIDTMPNLHGMFIVTHSRQLVKHLTQTVNPTHWRLAEDGMSLEQWAARETVPTDLDVLLKEGVAKWQVVNSMIKK